MYIARKCIAAFIIINHLTIISAPLLFSASLRAENTSGLSQSMDTLRSGLGNASAPVSAEIMTSQPSSTASFFPASGPTNEMELPALSAAELPQESLMLEDKLQAGVQSFWGVMASNNPAETGLNKATNMATGLANNAIRDWLSHKGNARIELNTRGRFQGQVLVPLWESDHNVLFGQLGVRNHSERTLYHVGTGWRSYASDGLMIGMNSFWDYDNTGNNSRAGIGAELWADNIKLAANGYFRLTDWHQSSLSSMRDYDERPANGFDLRAEAWHPAYPHLSANVKYEKYYGEGVILTGSTSPGNLTNSPQAWTAGVSYTPVPLVTIGTEHTRGNESETRLTLSLNYRFGQTWKELTDSNLVKISRSLLGQRYDFVDRNYDMVMQYRKQELINLKMPASITAEASSLLVLNADVKSKYGLKSLQWNTQEIALAGGNAVKQSPTGLLITLPPYREGSTNTFIVSAIATDVHDNTSLEVQTKISLTRSTNIVSLSASPANGLAASGEEVSVATAATTDQHGQPLAQMPVAFILSGSENSCTLAGSSQCQTTVLTNAQGIATVRVGHTAAGPQMLRAQLENGNSDSSTLHFIADLASARIDSLQVNTQGGIANGVGNEELTATVLDQNGNPVANAVITLSVTGNAQLSAASVQTNSEGKGTFSVSSHTAGAFQVTASTNNDSAQATVNFRADADTARIAGALTVISDNARANDSDENQVQATVTDAFGNAVSGVDVHFSASSEATLQPVYATTDSQGLASTTVKTTRAGNVVLTARVNASEETVSVNFIADASTARISIAPDANHAIANNTAQNSVIAVITDAWGNPVESMPVEFSADNGANVSGTLVSNVEGKVIVTLTSATAGDTLVSATLNNGQTGNTVVTFTADSASAELTSGSLSVITDNAPANGIAANAVSARVTDAQGNPVPAMMVSFSATQGASVVSASTMTNQDGVASTTIVSTFAGESVITGVVNGTQESVSVTFVADDSTAELAAGSLNVLADGALANGVAENVVQATVTDRHGNPVAGINVTFSANNGASVVSVNATSDADGLASTTITSTLAGESVITGVVSDSQASVFVTFIADDSTAELAAGSLNVLVDEALANGVAENIVQATVTDRYGNPVAGMNVTFSADNGASVVSVNATTDASGRASTGITSTLAGESQITATLTLSSASAVITFKADENTATLVGGVLVATANNATADGVAMNAVQATVTDAYHNPVSGMTVHFTATNGASVDAASATTNAQGQVSTTLTSIVAGVSVVTAEINASSDSTSVTFIADASTAQLTEENLRVIADGAIANGAAENIVEATVFDANGNGVPGITINFSADNDATVTPSSGITDDAGKVVVAMTSTRAGNATITAVVNGVNVSTSSQFIAGDVDAGNSSFTVSPAAIPADGTTESILRFEAKDTWGNPVPHLTSLLFAVNNLAVMLSEPVEISDGIYTATLKSVNAGSAVVTVTMADTPAEIISTRNITVYPLSFNGKVTFQTN